MNLLLTALIELPLQLDNAAAPPPGLGQQLLDALLSPSGIGIAITLVFSGIGLLVGTNEVRRRRVALAVLNAFNIAEDLAAETDNVTIDKIAEGLKAANKYLVANGWRPLKPGEEEIAKLGFTSLNGAQKIAEKVAVNALAATAPLIEAPTAGKQEP